MEYDSAIKIVDTCYNMMNLKNVMYVKGARHKRLYSVIQFAWNFWKGKSVEVESRYVFACCWGIEIQIYCHSYFQVMEMF